MSKTVSRSDIRNALNQRLGQIAVDRITTVQRLNSTAFNTVPLPVLLGGEATKQLLDGIMDELGIRLGTSDTIVILD